MRGAAGSCVTSCLARTAGRDEAEGRRWCCPRLFLGGEAWWRGRLGAFNRANSTRAPPGPLIESKTMSEPEPVDMNSRLPNQITVERGIGEARVVIWKGMGNRWKTRRTQLSVFSPRGVTPTSEFVCVLTFLYGDAIRHRDLSCVRQDKALRPAGEGSLYYLAPKCLYRGEYKCV